MFQATRRAFLAACSAVASLLIPDRESAASQEPVPQPEPAPLHEPRIETLNDWFEWLDYQLLTNGEYKAQLDQVASGVVHQVLPSFAEQVRQMLRRRKYDPTVWTVKQHPLASGELGEVRVTEIEHNYAQPAFECIKQVLHRGNLFVAPWRGGLTTFKPQEIDIWYDALSDEKEIIFRGFSESLPPARLPFQEGPGNWKLTDFVTHIPLDGMFCGAPNQDWCLPLWKPGHEMPTAEKMHEAILCGNALRKLKQVIERGLWLDNLHHTFGGAIAAEKIQLLKIV